MLVNNLKLFIYLGFVLITSVILTSCNQVAPEYWFPSENPAFKTIQDDGYVSIYNETQKQDGVSVTIQAIVSDQFTTYVRIKASLDFVEVTEQKTSFEQMNLENKIENAYLTDEDGNRLEYRNQVVCIGADGTKVTEINPVMKIEGLNKNEAILIFHGGPSKDTIFSFEITFKNQIGSFKFDGLKVCVPPVEKRYLNGVTFQTDYAKGTVKEINYTKLETRFTIEWVGTELAADYHVENKGIYYSEDESYKYILPYPVIYNDDGKIYTSVFILDRAINPQADLRIDRYINQYSTYVEEFLYIPANITSPSS
ncbi:MAG: hypothetical protein E7388_02930 [Ruminococcaceae bacterium]|nr:hypothetical protein [Oscillospiraceae bacterium]